MGMIWFLHLKCVEPAGLGIQTIWTSQAKDCFESIFITRCLAGA
jgi:hypothetical protein